MKRIARTLAAVLAIATTGAVLQGIAALAHGPGREQVVVLPRVEIVARKQPAAAPQAAVRGRAARAG